jgi:hypothetical protein
MTKPPPRPESEKSPARAKAGDIPKRRGRPPKTSPAVAATPKRRGRPPIRRTYKVVVVQEQLFILHVTAASPADAVQRAEAGDWSGKEEVHGSDVLANVVTEVEVYEPNVSSAS